jgi:hypothetical protein
VNFFLPVAIIVIQPSGYQISTDTVPVYFWRTDISSSLLGSSCFVKIYRGESLAIEATLKVWQFIGQAAFFTQVILWLVFSMPRMGTILKWLRSNPFAVMAAFPLLCCLGILLGPNLNSCFFGEKLNILSAALFWPNVLISLASISLGITAILKQKVMGHLA